MPPDPEPAEALLKLRLPRLLSKPKLFPPPDPIFPPPPMEDGGDRISSCPDEIRLKDLLEKGAFGSAKINFMSCQRPQPLKDLGGRKTEASQDHFHNVDGFRALSCLLFFIKRSIQNE